MFPAAAVHLDGVLLQGWNGGVWKKKMMVKKMKKKMMKMMMIHRVDLSLTG